MKISSAGLNLIKEFEGLCTTAYVCPAGVLTIGYGHTKDVKPNDVITKDGAEELLKKDLKEFEEAVTAMLDIREVAVNQCQFDALVCFAFNVGTKALDTSTLLKKLTIGDVEGASDEFLRWNKAGGKVLEGLTRRRQAERRLFLAKL